MDLALTQQELLQVGPISSRDTLVLLPFNKKSKQFFVVGTDNGTVGCYRIKRAEAQSVFKTASKDYPVLHLTIGGPREKKDRIFFSSKENIFGLSRKGKEFFQFNTNLSESVNSMCVEGSNIWTVGDYVYNLFDKGKDVNYYMSPDKITGLIVARVTQQEGHDAILGCESRNIRVISGSKCSISADVKGPVTAVHGYAQLLNGKPVKSPQVQFIYGTKDGQLGQLLVSPPGNATAETTLAPGWSLDGSSKGGSPVNCLMHYDITNDGVPDLVAGYDNGTVQVYGFDLGPIPTLQFSANLGESVRAICAGIVSSAGYDELVVCSFSGRITSFTSEPVFERPPDEASPGNAGKSKGKVQNESRIRNIHSELHDLRAKIAAERTKMSRSGARMPASRKQFTMNHSFSLDPKSGTYTATVETAAPLNVVLLQSSLDIDLVPQASSNAILSRTPPNPEEGNRLLATYRCQEACKRLEMRVHTVEGQYGELQALVMCKMTPVTAQTIMFTIKPLSLHYRCPAIPDDRPLNRITFSGTFNIRQMHEWVCFCLPEMPPRLPEKQRAEFCFMNAFVTSVLRCRYKKGEATLESDSISTIAILKEVITKLATERKVQIRTAFTIAPETMPNILKLLHPKLEYTLALSRKHQLIQGLKEIKMQQQDTSFLSTEYLDVVENSERIEEEFKDRPRALQALFGIVTDLYVDMHKFQGRDVKSKIPQLMRVLQNYDQASIFEFFNER